MPPHFPMAKDRKPWVKIDLDDTLSEYDGYKGWEVIGDPRPFAQSFVKLFKHFGWGVIIETGRSEAGFIWDWLGKWKFKYNDNLSVDYINQSPLNLEMKASTPKIITDLAIDNAMWPFCGSPVPLRKVAEDLYKRGIFQGHGMGRASQEYHKSINR